MRINVFVAVSFSKQSTGTKDKIFEHARRGTVLRDEIRAPGVFLQNINGLRAGALLGGAFTPEIFSSASGRPATCRCWFQARRHKVQSDGY
jgi:hypothetical protein